jgi:hypothetical protein
MRCVGERAVPEYRLYCLDKRGRILDRHDFDPVNDQAAMQIAHDREHSHLDCELWEGKRKVALIPAKGVADG